VHGSVRFEAACSAGPLGMQCTPPAAGCYGNVSRGEEGGPSTGLGSHYHSGVVLLLTAAAVVPLLLLLLTNCCEPCGTHMYRQHRMRPRRPCRVCPSPCICWGSRLRSRSLHRGEEAQEGGRKRRSQHSSMGQAPAPVAAQLRFKCTAAPDAARELFVAMKRQCCCCCCCCC
jgi:hypothetical protein